MIVGYKVFRAIGIQNRFAVAAGDYRPGQLQGHSIEKRYNHPGNMAVLAAWMNYNLI